MKEAAALIGRHVSQVHQWIDAGRLATRTDGATVVLSETCPSSGAHRTPR